MSYQLVFILNFCLIILMMKIISWSLLKKTPRPKLLRFLLTTPLLSARIQLKKYDFKESVFILLAQFLLSLIFLGFIIFIAKNFLQPLSYGKILLLSPFVYIFTEGFGALCQFIFYPFGTVSPIHRQPLIAKSLSQFWGHRWNFWVRDWLRDVSASHRHNLSKKLIITFLASGIFHELMVNLPYFIYFHESYFGNMMLYFLIQGMGLWIEKKWINHFPHFVRRIYLWIVVLLPAPLFINKPFLLFFGIIDG